MSTPNADDQTPPADAAGATQSAAGATDPADTASAARARSDEFKKKLEQHLGDLGKHMDALKDMMIKAAADAKVSIDRELDKLKKDHAGDFERWSKLQTVAETGLQHLGARLDKLVDDVTEVVTSALNKAEAEKKETDEAKAAAAAPEKSAADAKAAAPPPPTAPKDDK